VATVTKYIYRVGDLVKFKMGAHEVVAPVIEDRGKIGHGGEQVVRVAVPIDSTYHVEVDLSASLVSRAQGKAKLP
jgi:hypothetical protein